MSINMILAVVWLLGYPLVSGIRDVLLFGFPAKKESDKYYNENVRVISSLIELIIWFGFAYVIWIS